MTFFIEFSILNLYYTEKFLWYTFGDGVMPIYEYRCEDCKRRSSLLLRSFKEETRPVCPYCGGKKLRRVFSRFAMVRSEEDRLERLADPSKWGGIDKNDPKSVVRWAKRMGKEMGEEMGEDFDRMLEEELEGEATSSEEPPSED